MRKQDRARRAQAQERRLRHLRHVVAPTLRDRTGRVTLDILLGHLGEAGVTDFMALPIEGQTTRLRALFKKVPGLEVSFLSLAGDTKGAALARLKALPSRACEFCGREVGNDNEGDVCHEGPLCEGFDRMMMALGAYPPVPTGEGP